MEENVKNILFGVLSFIVGFAYLISSFGFSYDQGIDIYTQIMFILGIGSLVLSIFNIAGKKWARIGVISLGLLLILFFLVISLLPSRLG